MPMDIKGRGRVKSTRNTFEIEGITTSENHFAAIDSDGLVLFEHETDSILNDLSLMINHEKILANNIISGKSIEEILKLTQSFNCNFEKYY